MQRRVHGGDRQVDHLRVVESSPFAAVVPTTLDIASDELEQPETPAGYEGMLSLFWLLRRTAGSNGSSYNAISCSELLSWQQLSGVQLLPTEVDLIFLLDAAALMAFAEIE